MKNVVVFVIVLAVLIYLANRPKTKPTYNDVRQKIEMYDGQRLFDGLYPCSQDCSGHLAGYMWASKHDITDPNDCGGNSQSFMEGCIAYTVDVEAAYERDTYW